MGSADDPMAVTDPAGRVRGVPGLRVVDASLFPIVPCANTNIPTLMTAEKIADAILAAGDRASLRDWYDAVLRLVSNVRLRAAPLVSRPTHSGHMKTELALHKTYPHIGMG
jgi:choline dehydrogenase-like flavoprotein